MKTKIDVNKLTEVEYKNLEDRCRYRLNKCGYSLTKLPNNQGYFISNSHNTIVAGGQHPMSLSLDEVVDHISYFSGVVEHSAELRREFSKK